jgi:hypothetical protein
MAVVLLVGIVPVVILSLRYFRKLARENMKQTTPPRFREEQRFRQPWIWLLILFLVVLQWWGFIQQIVLGEPWGSRPAPGWVMVLLWLLFGIGLPFFFVYLRLIVTVTDEAIDMHFRPLTRRTIPMADVT